MRYQRLCILAGYTVLLEFHDKRYFLSLYEGESKRRLMQVSSSSFTSLDLELGRWLKAHRAELADGLLEG